MGVLPTETFIGVSVVVPSLWAVCADAVYKVQLRGVHYQTDETRAQLIRINAGEVREVTQCTGISECNLNLDHAGKYVLSGGATTLGGRDVDPYVNFNL